MTKEELLKEIMKLPKVETNNSISTMTSINVDDLMSAVDRLNKVPDYNDLLKENQELKKQLENYKKLGFKHLQDKNNNLKIHYEIKPSFTARKIKELQQERDLYKEVIDEVRKFIEDWLFDAGGNGASMTYEDINELLQILDKGESNE